MFMEVVKSEISKFEEYTLYLIALFIPIVTIPGWTYEYSTQKYAFFSILAFVVLVAAVWESRRRESIAVRFTLPSIGWGFFALSALLSLFPVAMEDTPYLRYSGQVALYVVLTFIFAIYLMNRVNTKRVMINILGMLLISAGFITLDAFINFYAGWDIWLGHIGTPYTRIAIRATIGNPDFVPDYLGVMLFVAFYFLISKDLGYKITKENAKSVYLRLSIIKASVLIEAIAMVAVIIFAQTRGDYLAVPASFVFFALSYTYYQNFKHKRKEETKEIPEVSRTYKKIAKLTTIFVIVFVGAVFLEFLLYSIPGPFTGGKFSVFGRVSTISSATTSGGSGQQRYLAWWAAFYQWKDHPIVGQGIGTYQTNVLHYLGVAVQHHPALIVAWNNFKRAHNDYVQVLGETGILGFASIVFFLISLLLYYLRVLKKQNYDNAMLMMLLASGALVTILTSVLSFAEHLMPDSMTLMFLLAFLNSNLFNKDKDYTWEWVFNKAKFVAVATVTLAIAGSVALLKTMYFVSEVYFLKGNVSYQYISAYQRAVKNVSSQLQSVKNDIQLLKSYKGKFAYLDPKNYIPQHLNALLMRNPNLNRTQASIQLEHQRVDEYNKQMNNLVNAQKELENNLNAFERNENISYSDAVYHFTSSLGWDWTYGTSEFYLGLLSTFPQRNQRIVGELNVALKKDTQTQLNVLKKLFYGKDPMTYYIYPPYRHLNYVDDYNLIAKLVKNGENLVKLWNELNINQLIQMQMYRDGIDYLQTSFLSFDEKNSYRLIAEFSSTLYHLERQQITSYERAMKLFPKFKTDFEKMISDHEKLANEDRIAMEKWYDKTIFILPGGWNRYPGWENVYSEYINNILRDTPMNAQTYAKIKEIAGKYVWIGNYMQRTYWAVPIKVFDIFTSLAQTFINQKKYAEALTVVTDTLKIFKPAYEWNLKDESRWKHNEKIHSLVTKFIKEYQELENNRATFLKQLKNVYLYTFTNPKTKKLAQEYLNDWNKNLLLASEQNMSTSDIISYVVKLEKQK